MRILFVGHSYHLKTRSCDFFSLALGSIGSVSHVCVSPESLEDAVVLESLNFASFDVVVLWQVDFLAAFFLSRGCPTIVVPMFDASASLPAAHWRGMVGALLVCFSRDLHLLAKSHGLNSIYVRYFPPLLIKGWDSWQTAGSPVSVFFWERNPASSLNAASVVKRFSGLVDCIHIHRAPDDPSTRLISGDQLEAMSLGAQLSFSSWFPDRNQLDEKIMCSQVFVAPRLHEGIGMSFLGAMSAGRIVVAHAGATHSDYIKHGRNGYLLDFQAINELPAKYFSISALSLMRARLRVDACRYADAWAVHYQACLMNAIGQYVDCYSSAASRFRMPFPAIYCFAAHCDTALYVSMLETWGRHLFGGLHHSNSLHWSIDLLDTYGEGALSVLEDMVRRPLVASDPERQHWISLFVSRFRKFRASCGSSGKE